LLPYLSLYLLSPRIPRRAPSATTSERHGRNRNLISPVPCWAALRCHPAANQSRGERPAVCRLALMLLPVRQVSPLSAERRVAKVSVRSRLPFDLNPVASRATRTATIERLMSSEYARSVDQGGKGHPAGKGKTRIRRAPDQDFLNHRRLVLAIRGSPRGRGTVPSCVRQENRPGMS
jgi:hypothetical protein